MKGRKAFIILTVLIMAATLTLMVAGFSVSIFYKNQLAIRYINSVKAYYLAYGGARYGQLQAAYANINSYRWLTYPDSRPKDTSCAMAFPGVRPVTGDIGKFSVKYEFIGDVFRITATGDINGVRRTIICEEHEYWTIPNDAQTYCAINEWIRRPVIKIR